MVYTILNRISDNYRERRRERVIVFSYNSVDQIDAHQSDADSEVDVKLQKKKKEKKLFLQQSDHFVKSIVPSGTRAGVRTILMQSDSRRRNFKRDSLPSLPSVLGVKKIVLAFRLGLLPVFCPVLSLSLSLLPLSSSSLVSCASSTRRRCRGIRCRGFP